MQLDNLDMIERADPEDALGVIAAAAEQLNFAGRVENKPRLHPKISKVVLSGMGGSCLAGLIAKNWLDDGGELAVPFEVRRDYIVPNYVDKSTLVICVSVSGNTEETLSSLRDAQDKHAQIVVIAGGGKLLDIAQEEKLPYVHIEKLSQPRYGVIMHLRAIVNLLHAYGLISTKPGKELDAAKNTVANFALTGKADVPTDHNLAKQLALDAAGKTVLVYSSRLFRPLAYKWKTSYNENAKNIVWTNEFPEFNHNEFIGWTSHPIEKPFLVVNLRSDLDSDRINQRFDLSEKLLSGKWPAAHNITLTGSNYIEQVICGAILGDFTSIYLGLLNGVDPTPVALVERFKKELG